MKFDHCSSMTVLLIMPRIIARLGNEATGGLRFHENVFSLNRVERLLSTSANSLNPLSFQAGSNSTTGN